MTTMGLSEKKERKENEIRVCRPMNSKCRTADTAEGIEGNCQLRSSPTTGTAIFYHPTLFHQPSFSLAII